MAKFVRVATASEIPAGTGMFVDVDGVPVALFNVGGKYYATSDVCTHEEASLSEGELDGECVECPLHGARFNVRTGEVKSLPAVVKLKTYPARVVGDKVEVEI
jgi:3-phenylpropionate/trans-cinnamate dioxygenase ferredoxin component